MPKTMSANEARNQFDSALKYVTDEHGEVIVEKAGEPAAVIVSFVDYEEFRDLREEKRRGEAIERLIAIREERKRNGTFSIRPDVTPEQRVEALARLEALREEVRAQNQDLTQEEAEKLAVQMSRDMIDHMAESGTLVFERDLRKNR